MTVRVQWPLATIVPLSIGYFLYKKKIGTFNAQGKIPFDEPTLKSSGRVSVDKKFLIQLKYILKICIPSIKSSTSMIVILHSIFLVLRTYLSVVVARIDGKLVKDLVGANGKEFIRGLMYWFLIALPATFTNSMIRYYQIKLSLSLRKRLTRHVHDIYLSNKNFYKAINLDHRIDSADQFVCSTWINTRLITTDVKKFCDALASLYSNLGKPVLDLIIFNYQLSRSIGISGMVGLTVNYYITATIMRAITPAFGKLTAEQAKLEGDFRSSHSRIVTNAEEIAFYHGANREESILNTNYLDLIKHVNSTLRLKISYHMFEDFIIKYSWSAVGLLISSIPVFFPGYAGSRTRLEEEEINSGDVSSQEQRRAGSRTQGFITNKRLLISLADAGGRIMYSYKELSELAGYTFRVYNLLKILESLNRNQYSKGAADQKYSISNVRGEMEYGYQGITFSNVPIVTPAGDTLLTTDLSFELKPGDHLMITGPNGAGKTSILRVLSGLWPLFEGCVRRPSTGLSNIMYIPQRPYLVIGTLRDQIIYPHTRQEMFEHGYQDQDLIEILKLVYLDYIPEREGGLDSVKEWKDVFSGGEKQRIQLARVFYHCPRFVVFDESTSAVSNDVEALMYGTAKEEGITIVTISHRPSLFKYHTLLLKVGEGKQGNSWTLDRIGGEIDLMNSVDAEIKSIQEKLKKKDFILNRLAEINSELSIEGKSQNSGIKRTVI